MERNSLIDPNKPLVIIQIEDGNYMSMATNIDDPDDVLDILEELVEKIHEMGVNSFLETNEVMKKFLQ